MMNKNTLVGVLVIMALISGIAYFGASTQVEKQSTASYKPIKAETPSRVDVLARLLGDNYFLSCFEDSDADKGLMDLITKYKNEHRSGFAILQEPNSVRGIGGKAAIFDQDKSENSRITVLFEGTKEQCDELANSLRHEKEYAKWFEQIKKQNYIADSELHFFGYDTNWTYLGTSDDGNHDRYFLYNSPIIKGEIVSVSVTTLYGNSYPLDANHGELEGLHYVVMSASYDIDCEKDEYSTSSLQWINSNGAVIRSKQYGAWNPNKIKGSTIMDVAAKKFCVERHSNEELKTVEGYNAEQDEKQKNVYAENDVDIFDSENHEDERQKSAISPVFESILYPIQQSTLPADTPQMLVMHMLEYALNDGGLSHESEIQQIKLQIESSPKPVRGNKKAARALNEKGLVSSKEYDFNSAVKMFEEANKLDNSDIEIVSNLGFSYFKQGNLDLAQQAIITTLTMSPGRAIAWANLGQVFGVKGDLNRAVACFSNTYRFSKDRLKTHQFMKKLNETEDVETVKQARAIAISWAEKSYLNI